MDQSLAQIWQRLTQARDAWACKLIGQHFAGHRANLTFSNSRLKNLLAPSFAATVGPDLGPEIEISICELHDLVADGATWAWPPTLASWLHAGGPRLWQSSQWQCTGEKTADGRVTLQLQHIPSRHGLMVIDSRPHMPIPGHIRAAPLRHLACWLAAQVGCAALHAGSLARPSVRGWRGVLLAGVGGSGKSTTVVDAVRMRCNTVGEDYVFSTLHEGEVFAQPLYDSVKLSPGVARRVGLPQPTWVAQQAKGSAKIVSHLSGLRVDSIIPRMQVQAVLRVVIDRAGPTRLAMGERCAALRDMGVSTALQNPGSRAAVLRYCVMLLEHLPVYELFIGPSTHNLPALLDDLLDRKSPPRAGLAETRAFVRDL